MRAGGVLLSFASRRNVLRAVTHLDVSGEDVERAIELIPQSLADAPRAADRTADAPTPY